MHFWISLFQVDEQGEDQSQNVILPHDEDVDTDEAKPANPLSNGHPGIIPATKELDIRGIILTMSTGCPWN